MQSSDKKFTFTIQVKETGVKEVTADLDKLSDTIDNLDKKIKSSDLSVSLGSLFCDSESFGKLFTDLGTQIEKLSQAVTTLSPIVSQLQEVQNASPKENKGERDDKEQKNKFAEELKPYVSTFAPTLKNIEEIFNKSKEEDKTFKSELLKAILEFVKSGGEKKEEKKDAAQQNANTAQQAKPDAAKKEEKKDQNASGGNFGLDNATLDKEKTKTDKITKANGKTDLEETRKQIEKTNKVLDDYQAKLNKSKSIAHDFYDFYLNQYEKDSDAYQAFLEAKAIYDKEYETKLAEGNKKRSEADKVLNEMQWGGMAKTADLIKDMTDKYMKYATGSIDTLKGLFNANNELYAAQAAEIKKEITEVDAKLKESSEKKKALLAEEKTATGGRLVVIQEQLAREMEANEELSKQKKELADKEKKLSDEAKKQQKRSQRLAVFNQIITSTANIAKGISTELAKGIWGIPTAAIIAAQGAIQIATIKKQYEKINMEDGGLLRGKRHSMGGMRIEGSNIEVEGGEFVVNRKSTSKNLGLIDFINTQRKELTPDDIKAFYNRAGKDTVTVNHQIMRTMYEDGGMLTNLSAMEEASVQSANVKILDAIGNINFRPVVSVVDIVNAQNSIVQVKDIAGV